MSALRTLVSRLALLYHIFTLVIEVGIEDPVLEMKYLVPIHSSSIKLFVMLTYKFFLGVQTSEVFSSLA